VLAVNSDVLTDSPRRIARTTRLRPEIQALRTIAVLGVVVYHLWPSRLSGGYAGVDVFFVISGFLIIGHLLRKVSLTGRVKLTEFWASRVRRLLPASLLVLGVTSIVTFLAMTTLVWHQWFREIAASAVYVQNIALSLDAVD
jgi:peptidoglycan/LPS O-acetylase OafA/YrhL